MKGAQVGGMSCTTETPAGQMEVLLLLFDQCRCSCRHPSCLVGWLFIFVSGILLFTSRFSRFYGL